MRLNENENVPQNHFREDKEIQEAVAGDEEEVPQTEEDEEAVALERRGKMAASKARSKKPQAKKGCDRQNYGEEGGPVLSSLVLKILWVFSCDY